MAALLFAAPFAVAGQADAQPLPDVLRTADIVILGEVHDNPEHHRLQAAFVAELRPKMLVFEMLSPAAAAAANAVAPRSEAGLRAATGWDTSGWPDFALYWPVFAAVPGAAIHGAALPSDEVRRAVSEGAAAVFGGDAGRWGLTEPLDPAELAERVALQRAAHCDALPEHLLPGMVEAQRLRDAAFARTALEAFEATGGPVVVIAGAGHARRDWGIPAALGHGAPGLRVAAVGMGETDPAGTGAPADEAGLYDEYIATPPPADRGDPCAGFH